MKIRIHDGDVPIDDLLRAHLERRLGYALSAFGDRVKDIVVRVSSDAPAGSPPLNRCDIDVTLRPRHLRVADTGANPFMAVANASDRLVRAVGRAVEREQAWTAGGPSQPKKKRRR